MAATRSDGRPPQFGHDLICTGLGMERAKGT
jgi:hypothetical protein